jgi:hypothetical protein
MANLRFDVGMADFISRYRGLATVGTTSCHAILLFPVETKAQTDLVKKEPDFKGILENGPGIL